MSFTSNIKLRPWIYLVSLAGACAFWTLEALMEKGFTTSQSSLAVIFPAGPGELWFRILVGLIIIAFAISYQERFSYIRKLELQLDSLREKGSETPRTYVSLCSSCQQKEQHQMFHDHEEVIAGTNMPATNYWRTTS